MSLYASGSNSNSRQQTRTVLPNSSIARAAQDRIPSSRFNLPPYALHRRTAPREESDSAGQGDNRALPSLRRAIPSRRYEEWETDGISDLSGWVALARDDAHPPDVLILDGTSTPLEPTLEAEPGTFTERPAYRLPRGAEFLRSEAALPWHSTFTAGGSGSSARRHVAPTDRASDSSDSGGWGQVSPTW